ncbi:signal transduction histidine kinase [Arthrobacter pigmenti]|uniref:histidine kinase n=1 Tax=Arthrobacter pigmenti TaxID=271432 RepID=A0A846RSJ0_9MICC|nr:HAMP domain-containing sensor histidine kinase [Arthrobacter pigmenti]NJC23137.1 signal transduction histidine kinase [Arthrobacter pigmenti]
MSERVLFVAAKRSYSKLSLRARVGLCELPLATLVVAAGIAALVAWPTLANNPAFIAGVLMHLVLLAVSFLAPWERLPEGSYIVIPLLDFVAIGLTNAGANEQLPGIALLAVFPVIWISASGVLPFLGLIACFAGPFLILGLSALLGSDRPVFTAFLFGAMMVSISVSIRFASLNTAHSRRKLKATEAEVDHLRDVNTERERLLETILDTIDVGLVALDSGGRRTLTNRQQRSYDLLVETGDDDGGHLYGADKSTPLSPHRQPVQRAAAGETFSNYLVWLGPKDSQRAVATAATAMKDTAGRFAGSVIVSNDVTNMVETLSAKEDFVSNVSHELWTPLTSILGHLDLVLDDEQDLPPGVADQLSVARRNAERLYALVSDLLAAASGAASVHLRPTDLTGIVEHSIESAWPQASDTGVTLKADVPEILWTTSDPLRIRQVLDNLISNAIKYSPDGGTVTVRARQQCDAALLEVQDTGIGMSPSETSLIFGKFFRTVAARESSIPGVGLGLSITKAIVDSHGGTIHCTSVPGSGTTFTVTLPLHRSQEN